MTRRRRPRTSTKGRQETTADTEGNRRRPSLRAQGQARTTGQGEGQQGRERQGQIFHVLYRVSYCTQ